jgi:hypothetical protein
MGGAHLPVFGRHVRGHGGEVGQRDCGDRGVLCCAANALGSLSSRACLKRPAQAIMAVRGPMHIHGSPLYDSIEWSARASSWLAAAGQKAAGGHSAVSGLLLSTTPPKGSFENHWRCTQASRGGRAGSNWRLRQAAVNICRLLQGVHWSRPWESRSNPLLRCIRAPPGGHLEVTWPVAGFPAKLGRLPRRPPAGGPGSRVAIPWGLPCDAYGRRLAATSESPDRSPASRPGSVGSPGGPFRAALGVAWGSLLSVGSPARGRGSQHARTHTHIL